MRPSCGIAQVDAKPQSLGRNFPVEHPVAGDVRTALRELLADREICASLEATKAAREAWAGQFLAGARYYDEATRESDAAPLHPARVVRDLRSVLPRDAALLVDSGAHRAFAGHHFPVLEPMRFFSATGIGPMGWALGAAAGVACALPGTRIAVVTGDGCMLQNGLELATAARHHLPILFVVFINAALGNVYLRARKAGAGAAAFTILRQNDWAAFASSLGVKGRRVTELGALAAAFGEFLESDGPMLVDALCDREAATPIEAWSRAAGEPNVFSE